MAEAQKKPHPYKVLMIDDRGEQRWVHAVDAPELERLHGWKRPSAAAPAAEAPAVAEAAEGPDEEPEAAAADDGVTAEVVEGMSRDHLRAFLRQRKVQYGANDTVDKLRARAMALVAQAE